MEIIVTTDEGLEKVLDKWWAKHNPVPTLIPHPLPLNQPETPPEPKFINSIKGLADFLGCSPVTAQKLKNSGRIRYRQYGRKVIFSTAEILEDINKSERRKR